CEQNIGIDQSLNQEFEVRLQITTDVRHRWASFQISDSEANNNYSETVVTPTESSVAAVSAALDLPQSIPLNNDLRHITNELPQIKKLSLIDYGLRCATCSGEIRVSASSASLKVISCQHCKAEYGITKFSAANILLIGDLLLCGNLDAEKH
ncbi:MAG: hypothetical protein HQM16_15430, partial [Deltaproteobacteria bacterium]|nr:hypothetical protein [Deltaproteobacteria bacterium]